MLWDYIIYGDSIINHSTVAENSYAEFTFHSCDRF